LRWQSSSILSQETPTPQLFLQTTMWPSGTKEYDDGEDFHRRSLVYLIRWIRCSSLILTLLVALDILATIVFISFLKHPEYPYQIEYTTDSTQLDAVADDLGTASSNDIGLLEERDQTGIFEIPSVLPELNWEAEKAVWRKRLVEDNSYDM